MSDKKKTEPFSAELEREEAQKADQERSRIQTERALVAKFMGVSIDKVVSARSGGWTTR